MRFYFSVIKTDKHRISLVSFEPNKRNWKKLLSSPESGRWEDLWWKWFVEKVFWVWS